jgi:hypothetical protein
MDEQKQQHLLDGQTLRKTIKYQETQILELKKQLEEGDDDEIRVKELEK